MPGFVAVDALKLSDCLPPTATLNGDCCEIVTPAGMPLTVKLTLP
jgi:hypothetical protein